MVDRPPILVELLPQGLRGRDSPALLRLPAAVQAVNGLVRDEAWRAGLLEQAALTVGTPVKGALYTQPSTLLPPAG